MIKNGDTLKNLLIDVASLKEAVDMLKRFMWLAVGSSMTAAFGVILQLMLTALRNK